MNDRDLDPIAAFDQMLRESAAERPHPPLRPAITDHDARKAVLLGIGEDIRGRTGARQAHDLSAQIFCQPEILFDASTVFFVKLFVTVALQIDGIPRRTAARRHAFGMTDQAGRERIGADQQHDLLPDLRLILAHGGAQFVALGINSLGGATQRHFAQGQKIAFLEEVFRRALIGPLRDIDLTFR